MPSHTKLILLKNKMKVNETGPLAGTPDSADANNYSGEQKY